MAGGAWSTPRLPTVAFIVANAVDGLWAGVWAALAAGVVLSSCSGWCAGRACSRPLSGLFAVAIAVAIAAFSGQARDFFVFGIVRNAASRGPAGVDPAPLSAGGGARGVPGAEPPRRDVHSDAGAGAGAAAGQRRPAARGGEPEPEAERPWREDRRLMRAYTWLTLAVGRDFLLRVAVQALLYQANRRVAARHDVDRARPAADRRR